MRITENFREEHVLPDGGRITVRAIRPEDTAELRRAFARLSPASRQNRFLLAPVELSNETLHYLCDVDFDQHVALVATSVSHDLKTETGLGVARFVRLAEDPDVAEAAVTVVDAEQRRGIGRVLLTTLTEAARERGVRAFCASVLGTNDTMRRILAAVGASMRRDDGDVFLYEVALEPGDRPDEHPLRTLLRAAAASVVHLFRA